MQPFTLEWAKLSNWGRKALVRKVTINTRVSLTEWRSRLLRREKLQRDQHLEKKVVEENAFQSPRNLRLKQQLPSSLKGTHSL